MVKAFHVFLQSTLFIAGGLLLGCQPGLKIEQSFENATQQNKESQSYLEWVGTENHPERLFARLKLEIENGRSLDEVSGAICQVLDKMSLADLTVFEVQIYDESNREILRPCFGGLAMKLDQHYRRERANLEAEGMDTLGSYLPGKIPFKVIERDMAQGLRFISGDLPDKHVVLTFDDGPHRYFTVPIVKALGEYGVKAHFFMLGNNVKARPNLAQYVAEQGHSIANHSMSHPCMGTAAACGGMGGASERFAKNEIIQAHQLLFDTVGFVDPIFRFPYGASTPNLRKFLSQNQTSEFFWSVDSLDWKAGQTNRELIVRTMQQIERQRRGIVLFHDIQRRTSEVLPEILSQLRSGGYTVVLLQPKDPSQRKNHPFLNGPVKLD